MAYQKTTWTDGSGEEITAENLNNMENGINTNDTNISNLYTILGFPQFNTSTAYAIGDSVVKDGLLYTFTSAHSAGAWNASQVTQDSLFE